MKAEKLNIFLQTLRHVKATQLYHQVYYRVRNRLKQRSYSEKTSKGHPLNYELGIQYSNSYLGDGKFIFLNLEKVFNTIDWNFSNFGKLWVYNLNYFEYLHQEAMTKEQGLELMKDYVTHQSSHKDGLEPYPISLRGINWIKFLSQHKIEEETIDNCLFQDYQRLLDNLEYHLLANHLLENAFSLLFGAYYFQDEQIYAEAKKLLQNELKEQILKDGAHYELSPMYHQIILHRVLDSYNLVKSNSWKDQELLPLLKGKAEEMLGWLKNISFTSGEIPKINDAADGIAPTTPQLLEYAKKLGLKEVHSALSDSGYRKFSFDNFECLMDVGQIAPSYQPGHSHADNLNFVLHYKDTPLIVDTGISTYEKNERRQIERSTASHNTVTINGLNSSAVWDGFRVAERAETFIEIESDERIVASHNGYRSLNAMHRRSFQRKKNTFAVEDEVISKNKVTPQGHLHFHPQVKVEQTASGVILNDELRLEITGASSIFLQEYQFAEGYNKLLSAKKVIYEFENNARIEIRPMVGH